MNMGVQYKCSHFFTLGMNVLITVLFIVFEQVVFHTKEALIMDIICTICAVFFSLLFISKYLNWTQVDISPFFFWTLIVKRIVIAGVSKNEFIYFLFGFLNGQYASKQDIGDQNKYCLKARSLLQAIAFLILIICNSQEIFEEYNVNTLIILILLAIFISLNDNINVQEICKTPDQCMTDLKSTNVEVKKQATLIQTRGKWDQYIENNDDWICKIEVNRYQYIDSIVNSEQNYSLRKQLQDYKVELSLLFNKMIVTNCSTNLQQSVQLWSEVNEQATFEDWLKSNFFSENSIGKMEIRKRMESKNKVNFDGIAGMVYDDQSLYSPQNEQKIDRGLKDQVNEISDLSAIPHNLDPMGSGSIQQMRTSTLNCHINVNQPADLNVIVSNIDEEGTDGTRKCFLIIVMRNNDKYMRTKQAQEKLEQQSLILFKHIGRMAADIGKLIQQINETKKYFANPKEQDKQKLNNFLLLSFCDDQFVKPDSDQKISHHLSVPQSGIHSSIQRLTSSHSNNHDSQEEQRLFQKIQIGQFQQQQEILRQVEKAYYLVVMLEQNNFNFYELFSHTKWKEDKFNLSTTFNAIKELFKNNPTLIKYSIFIVSEIINEDCMIITADKQKIKQILINLINNAIESYEKQADNKNQKIIKIKAIGSKDKVAIEITDNGGGIQQDSLKSRLNDCKFGLAACQRILHLIWGDSKTLEIINYIINSSGQRGTKIQFFIPRETSISSQVDEYRQFDSLKVSNRVENFETQN